MSSICSGGFVWILPPREVDPVSEDGVGIEVKVDGVIVLSLEARIFVTKFVVLGKIAADKTGLAVSSSMRALLYRAA